MKKSLFRKDKMFKNIFKISVVLCLFAFAQARHSTQIAAHLSREYSDEINTAPFVRVGNKLYHFGTSKASWFKSFLICRLLGGFLASLDTQEELTELSKYLVANYPIDRTWFLSGSDLDSKGDFHWYRTGESISFADWSSGQPDNKGGNERCVQLWFIKTKYQMNDVKCDHKSYFICEADNPKTIVVSIF